MKHAAPGRRVAVTKDANGWTARDELRSIVWDNIVAVHREDDYFDGYRSEEEWWEANLLGPEG